MGTSSTARPTCLRAWMASCGADCAACWKSAEATPGTERVWHTDAGPMNGLPAVDCCRWQWNTSGRGQSYLYEPTNWKAGCGRPASPVWREGWRERAIPTPIGREAPHEQRGP